MILNKMDILKLNKNLNLDDIYNDLHKYSNSIRKQILELNNLMSLQVSYNWCHDFYYDSEKCVIMSDVSKKSIVDKKYVLCPNTLHFHFHYIKTDTVKRDLFKLGYYYDKKFLLYHFPKELIWLICSYLDSGDLCIFTNPNRNYKSFMKMNERIMKTSLLTIIIKHIKRYNRENPDILIESLKEIDKKYSKTSIYFFLEFLENKINKN